MISALLAAFMPLKQSIKGWISAAWLLPGLCSILHGQILPGSPTSEWVALLYGNMDIPDAGLDQQTGSEESDIVGNSSHPAFYMKFMDSSIVSPTNGWLGFRFRLGADVSPVGYKAVAFVGIDADMDGKLDLFVGVNNQGSSAQLAIWNPGNTENTSPSTTSVITPALRTYAETSANYSFTAVNSTIDPPLMNLDLDGRGRTDQFLSLVVPFGDVVAELNARGISGFTKDTPVRLVAATATQQNRLNQDLNGVLGGANSTATWQQLGGFTLPYSFASLQPVPEPPAIAVVLVGTALLLFRRRSK